MLIESDRFFDASVFYVMQRTLRYSNHVSWIRAKPPPINLALELTFGDDVYFAKAQVSVETYSDTWPVR